MSQEKPPHQNPALPDFWEHRYRNGVTPWDLGDVPAALRDFAAGSPSRRTLIPGCGKAHEAGYLASLGWDVTALDFSPAAIEAARQTLGEDGRDWPGRLVCADFFDFDPGERFDLVYERAFLCALPRRMWPGYAPRVAGLLVPGGLLAGFFYFGDEPKGPPFGISPDELEALLAPDFERLDDRPVEGADSLPPFSGRERWQVWRRL